MRAQGWMVALFLAWASPPAYATDQPIESELKERYEGKLVRLYPTTSKERFRLKLPAEDKKGAVPNARIYVKVESIITSKNRIEFRARRVVPYLTFNGEQRLAAGNRHEYLIEWAGPTPGATELIEAIELLARPVDLMNKDWPPCGDMSPQAPTPPGTPSKEEAPKPQKITMGVTPPECEFCPDPYYTDETRRQRIEGAVVVHAVITEVGQAACLRIGKSLHPQLDASAALAVGSWRFKPAMKGGKPVYVYLTVEVNFRPYSNRVLR